MERLPPRPSGQQNSMFTPTKVTLTEVTGPSSTVRPLPRYASSSNLPSSLPHLPLLSTWCSRVTEIMGEMWRRIRLEYTVELPMLKKKWRIMLFGIIMQYVHAISTQFAHRMHKPGPPLQDLGFSLTDPFRLTDKQFWVSEVIFAVIFISFVIWTFSPFFVQAKRFYTVLLWSRLLMVFVVCQALRIISFSVTSLPGPAPHCQQGVPSATREWPKHWTGHIVVNLQRQASRSCGDLIFSSHTTFALVGVLTYHVYGTIRGVKIAAWLLMAFLSVMIVASHKHYTVDVIVAWYTVPLVFYFMHSRWTTKRPVNEGQMFTYEGDGEADDAHNQESAPLLPVTHDHSSPPRANTSGLPRSNSSGPPRSNSSGPPRSNSSSAVEIVAWSPSQEGGMNDSQSRSHMNR